VLNFRFYLALPHPCPLLKEKELSKLIRTLFNKNILQIAKGFKQTSPLIFRRGAGGEADLELSSLTL
jgi:hypothetical protein